MMIGTRKNIKISGDEGLSFIPNSKNETRHHSPLHISIMRSANGDLIFVDFDNENHNILIFSINFYR